MLEGQMSMYDTELDYDIAGFEPEKGKDEKITEDEIDGIVDFLRPVSTTALDTKKFVKDFDDNVERAYNYVLSLQNDKNPLKRGGENVVYRAEALIIANKQTYNVHEDKLFDLLLTLVGSKPEQEVYQLTITDMKRNLPAYDAGYLYEILEKGQDGLKNKPLLFKTNNEDNDVLSVSVPWYDIFIYLKRGRDNVETNTLTFKPNKFFKLLASSSGITHGAHYRLSVSNKFSQRYVKNLFVLLEDKKKFTAFPGARQGSFSITIEEMKEILNIPVSYKANDIKRRVIELLQSEMSEMEDIDIKFDYAPVYMKQTKGAGKQKIIGFRFDIYQIEEGQNGIDILMDAAKEMAATVDSETEKETDETEIQFVNILKGIGLSESDALRVAKKAKENNRDIVYLTQAIAAMASKSNIKSSTAVLCDMMDNGIWSEEKKKSNTERSANRFNNFSQRKYDVDELEKKLLARNK